VREAPFIASPSLHDPIGEVLVAERARKLGEYQ
jgi:hypothetical protein